MKLQCAIVVLYLSFTAWCGVAYSQSNEAVKLAVHEQRIDEVEKAVVENKGDISTLALRVDDLMTSQNRMLGIGLGIGATLTILQALHFWLAVRDRMRLPQ